MARQVTKSQTQIELFVFSKRVFGFFFLMVNYTVNEPNFIGHDFRDSLYRPSRLCYCFF